MKTLTKWMLAALSMSAVVGCDPFQEAVGGPPAVIDAGFTDSTGPVAYPATLAGTAWTADGVIPYCGFTAATPTVVEMPGFIYVRFNKQLDGTQIQESVSSCKPATALNLQVTYNGSATPPAGREWFACYFPGAPAPTEGAAIFIFLGPCTVAGPSCTTASPPPSGWLDTSEGSTIPASGDAVTTVQATGTAHDKDGAAVNFDVTVNIASDPGLPDTPAFSNFTATSVTLDWGAPACTATTQNYDVQRAPDAAGAPGTFTTIAPAVTGLTYTDNTYNPANVYWYRLVAHTSAPVRTLTGGEASTALTLATPTFSNVSTTSLTVNWVSPNGATFDVLRAPDVSGTPGTFAPIATAVTGSSYNDTGPLTAVTKYWYRVVAHNPNTVPTTVTSPNAAVFTAPPAPAAPTFSNVTSSSVTVGWTAVAGAQKYNVQRAPDVSGAPGTFTTVAYALFTTTYASTGLAANTPYWYRVVAIGPGGSSIAGTSATVTTLP